MKLKSFSVVLLVAALLSVVVSAGSVFAQSYSAPQYSEWSETDDVESSKPPWKFEDRKFEDRKFEDRKFRDNKFKHKKFKDKRETPSVPATTTETVESEVVIQPVVVVDEEPQASIPESARQLTSIFVIGISLANVQTANLQRRMDDIRAGITGFSSSGFAVNGTGPNFWEGFANGEGFAGVSGAEGKSGPSVFAPIPQNRWGAFVTGIGEFTNVDSTFNASGYDLATGGFTAGLDYRIGSNFAVGLTGGYAYTGADLVNDGSISVNGGKLGLYATAFGSGFYLDTAVIGGLSGYDTRRTAPEGTASGETIGGDLNVLVAAGYDWKVGGLSIGPTASFQYTLVGFDSFSESGSLAPLAYPSQHADSYRTAFGMRASYDWKIGPVLFIPEVRLAWQHEFGDTDYSLVSSFASGAGNSFTVVGPEIGRDSMLLSAGFAIQWSDRISTYAYYDGELFRINYLSNNVSVGARITF